MGSMTITCARIEGHRRRGGHIVGNVRRGVRVQDGQLDHNVGRMRYLTMELLLRVSRSFKNQKLPLTFLTLNFRHVCLVRVQSCAITASHYM